MANRVLPREDTGHSKHPLPVTQEKTLHVDITRWSTPTSIMRDIVVPFYHGVVCIPWPRFRAADTGDPAQAEGQD